MSKTRRWVIILLSLVALILIGLNLAGTDDSAQPEANPDDPTYTSEHTDTVVYSRKGRLTIALSPSTWRIFLRRSCRGSLSR
ncbi:Lipopolysaccharide export system protein lptC [Raoultella terrigena]|uniref:Lipopolysaccharide export system protein lptC n=1 Tax=Raoultella terrigena TaxID=577 RepID=A0A3P8K6P4_RAOTE|nr:Lipopolysaccharide export system protein lptC [Raoultella terrigena]